MANLISGIGSSTALTDDETIVFASISIHNYCPEYINLVGG